MSPKEPSSLTYQTASYGAVLVNCASGDEESLGNGECNGNNQRQQGSSSSCKKRSIQGLILLVAFTLGAVLSRTTNPAILRYTDDESTTKKNNDSSHSDATATATTDVPPAESSQNQEEVDQWARIKAESQSTSSSSWLQRKSASATSTEKTPMDLTSICCWY
jgi:hypothetical protein